jgi:hypothetical protein
VARSLNDLALAHGTDKAGAHSYTDAYELHLGRFRDRPVRLLEIGVGGYEAPDQGGESLRMWKEYFPQGQIFGLDIYDKSSLAEERITIVQGDQGDERYLEALAAERGPFDIVIDDGSHLCAHVIKSFQTLFPHVVDKGVYVIEDVQTSYWATYANPFTPPGTTMALLKGLADGLNYAEFDVVGYEPSYSDVWVQSLTLYHNIAFIQKGANREPSNVLPPHPRSARVFDRSLRARLRSRLRASTPAMKRRSEA